VTSPAKLVELADRCAAATGTDRELDIQIKAELYGGVALLSPFNGEWCVYRAGTDDPRSGKVLERPRNVDFETWRADRYTASLDAAITLIAENDGLSIVAVRTDRWSVALYRQNTMGSGSTRALALCAAALRARAATQGNPND
jgi:hypothetical protein